jgi:putative membrane protein
MTVTTRKKRGPGQYVGLVLRGMAMGASDIVPGVSGGTMAFILGIYEELIQSIRDVAQPGFVKAAITLKLREALAILNWPFLLSVGTGILLSIFTLSQILESLLENQPVYLWSFFFGLVLSSIWVVSKRIKVWRLSYVAALLLAAAAAYLLVGLVPAQTPDAPWFLFLSGALAICAMVLPGVSGAFILVLLGKYQYVLAAVNDLDLFALFFVAAGAGIGIVTFAQVLGWLFKRYHDATVAALIGLMVGSLRKIWPWKLDVEWLRDADGAFALDSAGERIVALQRNLLPTLSDNGAAEIGTALLLALIGFGLILLLDRLALRMEGDAA